MSGDFCKVGGGYSLESVASIPLAGKLGFNVPEFSITSWRLAEMVLEYMSIHIFRAHVKLSAGMMLGTIGKLPQALAVLLQIEVDGL
jgi:hypothetical protein